MHRVVRPVLTLFLFSLVQGCFDSDSSGTTDADADGVSATRDCNDGDPTVSQVATYYTDFDRDGVGTDVTMEACSSTPPESFAVAPGDCNDHDPAIQNPITYVADADGDGVGGGASMDLCVLSTPAGFASVDGDCDDQDGGLVHEQTYYVDGDLDGFGAGAPVMHCASTPPAGFAANADDPDDLNAASVPDDLDGDGTANAVDCAPNDASVYVFTTYYDDVDGDGLGVDPTDLCGPLPAPARPGYADNPYDSCPLVANAGRDFDEDALDDACDAQIHFAGQKDVRESVHFPLRLAATGELIDYRFEPGPLDIVGVLRFKEGADLRVDACVRIDLAGVYIEFTGGIADTSDRSELQIGESEPADQGCTTQLVGSGVAPESYGASWNAITFKGGGLVAGKRVVFDGLGPVHFQPDGGRPLFSGLGADLRNDPEPGITWELEDYLTVKRSAEQTALVVSNQYLDLRLVRLIDNPGYPLSCAGPTYVGREGTSSRGTRHRRTTCQQAMNLAYFSGNGRDGLLVQTDHRDGMDPDAAPNLYWRDPALQPSPAHGTDTLYVSGLILEARPEADLLTTFREVVVKVARFIVDEGVGPVERPRESMEIRMAANTAGRTTTIQIESSDFSDVPIRFGRQALVTIDDSTIGPMSASPNLSSLATGAPLVTIQDSVLDFTRSSLLHEVLVEDDPQTTVIAGLSLVSASGGNPGRIQISNSHIIADTSVDHPFVYVSEIVEPWVLSGGGDPPVPYSDQFEIDAATTFEGTSIDDLIFVSEEQVSTAGSLFPARE